MLYSLQNSAEDWQYRTEPAEGMLHAIKGRRSRWPRGKVVGGTSVLNAMIYLRGNPSDYNNWAAQGNEGWDYDSVVKTFRKVSRQQRILVKTIRYVL